MSLETQRFDDESKVKEGEEHDVELVETGENAAEPLEPPEESLDFVAAAIEHPVEFPGLQAGPLGRHDGYPSEIQSQLACLIVLIGAVHQQRHRLGQRAQAAEQFPAVRGVVSLAGRESKGYRRSSICGNHMNLGGPSAAGFADRLRTVFFNAAVPSGWTFTMVESIDTASILMRTNCSRCSFSKKASSTAVLGPAVHAGVNGVPVSEAFGQAAPLAALLGNIQNGVENREVRQAHIASLARQNRFNAPVLLLGDLHITSIADLVN